MTYTINDIAKYQTMFTIKLLENINKTDTPAEQVQEIHTAILKNLRSGCVESSIITFDSLKTLKNDNTG